MQRNQCIQQKDTTRQHQLLQWSLTSPNKQLLPTANPPIPSPPAHVVAQLTVPAMIALSSSSHRPHFRAFTLCTVCVTA